MLCFNYDVSVFLSNRFEGLTERSGQVFFFNLDFINFYVGILVEGRVGSVILAKNKLGHEDKMEEKTTKGKEQAQSILCWKQQAQSNRPVALFQ